MLNSKFSFNSTIETVLFLQTIGNLLAVFVEYPFNELNEIVESAENVGLFAIL